MDKTNRAVGTIAGSLMGASFGMAYGIFQDPQQQQNLFSIRTPEQQSAFDKIVVVDAVGGAAAGALLGTLLGGKALIGLWLVAGAVTLISRGKV